MPAVLAGICVWVALWVFTGSSCWIRSIFGVPCPGCGSTRAVAEIFRGNIAGALSFHPLVFVSVALVAVCAASFVFDLNLFGKSGKTKSILLWGCVVVYLGVYIVRMAMFFPESEPMTYLASSMLGRVIGLVRGIFT